MERKPEGKKEGEYPAQECGWEAKRLADEQMHLAWAPLVLRAEDVKDVWRPGTSCRLFGL